jgi:hypothetical protein
MFTLYCFEHIWLFPYPHGFCNPVWIYGMKINDNDNNDSTVVPPYPLIKYPRFQLHAVYRGPKKKFKIK